MRRIDLSYRLKRFPPYLFAEIDREKQKLRRRGIDFIDLSIGDPDTPAPQEAIKALFQAAKLKENQKYALDQGKEILRQKIKRWFKKRFKVELDHNKEILPLLGSKEGLVHFPLGVVNKGDYVIIPSPGYPGYRGAALFCEAKIYSLPLKEENGFLPTLEKIPLTVRNKARLIYLNYPHNPTTAICPLPLLKKIVRFCSHYGIIIAYDNAYSEIYFEEKPVSILEIEEAREICLEFHSFSKTFSMTGFRLGWVCGNEKLIKILLKVKTNIDSGIFGAIQEAGVAGLDVYKTYTSSLRKIFKDRRDYFVSHLENYFPRLYSQATFYVWGKLPFSHKSSLEFSKWLLTEKNIVATPGIGFGKEGEGFIRFSLTVEKRILKKAIERLRQ